MRSSSHSCQTTGIAVYQASEFVNFLHSAIADFRHKHATVVYVNHQATQKNDIDEYVLQDRNFYEILAKASQNSFLAETIPRIFNLHLRLWFFISLKLGGWHSIAEAHEEMTHDVAEAIAQKDADRAELAMKNYISQRQQDMRRAL